MKADDILIRRLQAGDIDAVRQLNEVFATCFDDAETYLSARPGEAYLAELLGKEHVIPLVAISDGKVIGGLVAYEFDKFEQKRREIYIYDLAVDERFRRQGIATRLIEQVRLIARERNAWVIYLQADKGDTAPITLYSKLGSREDVLHFDIPPG